MGHVIFIRAQNSQFSDAVPLVAPRPPNVWRAAGYVAVTGLGLAIGLVLGAIAALMLGLIALC